MSDPLAHIRTLAQADPAKWGPALAEHERQLSGVAKSATTAKPPPLWRQALTFTVALAQHIKAGLPMARKRLARQRLAICKACPRYLADSGRCGSCGCNMAIKTTWQLSNCPEGKW
jgi:hypothetical protein